MSLTSLLIGIAVTAQVAPAGDRYSPSATEGAAEGGTLESIDGGFGDAAAPIAPLSESQGSVSEPPSGQPVTGNTSSATSSPPAESATSTPFTSLHAGVPAYDVGRGSEGLGSAYPPPNAKSQGDLERGGPTGTYPARSGAAPQSTTPNAAGTEASPSALMRAMLRPHQASRLAGQPMSLIDVISLVHSRDDQSVCIDAYWQLCASVADYYMGLHEQDELRRLRGRFTTSTPSAEWQQAESELSIRVSTAQLAALASQYRLAALLNRPRVASGLPLPIDAPHCGDYQARYEQNFGGNPNDEARELSALLPLRFEELKSAASAVARAELSLSTVGQGGLAGDETSALRAAELLALRRRAFVQIVCDYNRRIARYSELATPGEIGTERLVSMLIKSQHAPSTATRSSSTLPPFERQSRSLNGAPLQTYAEGWTPVRENSDGHPRRDEAIEQASAETQTLRKEKSLLVRP